MKLVDTYLQRVTSYIKSKEARTFVMTELKQHIKQTQQAWMSKGLTEDDALQKAIAEMGSPSTLGESMNKIHKPKVDWFLIGLLVSILVLSFLPLMSQTMYSFTLLGKRKAIFVVLGIILAISMMYLDYRKLQKYGYVFFGIGTAILLLLSLFPTAFIHGQPVFMIGPLRIESMMAMPFYVIAWASLFHNRTNLFVCIALFTISSLLFVMNFQITILFVYIALVAVLFLYSPFSKKIKLIATGIGVSLGIGIVLWNVILLQSGAIKPYQIERITAFFNPEKYANGMGYIYMGIRNTISQAKWVGASDRMHLSEAHTNYVLANVIQSYGYFLAILILLLFAVCIIRLLLISLRVRDPYARLLLVGGVTVLVAQVVYHVGMTFGFLPIIAMPMPLISYGLMPTMLGSFIMGIALSVWRRKSLYVDFNGPVR
ncbi:hypothetical protein AEA09_08595 [Lysinibacillus contaminans]|uniref:Cell division protein FtsW n=1 Tax=Lysinibacillus contaminans TaxID=1293441 RepID=A0ABR5K110_9BACI|nr:FtsW/RodA/SpoVE family cell cycle protein [Lysinibacillus contaminans]KOS68600.1 hypothetical protein AEA09_08595 [Lysinibacillus contaminans]